jgi:hypothetical protein
MVIFSVCVCVCVCGNFIKFVWASCKVGVKCNCAQNIINIIKHYLIQVYWISKFDWLLNIIMSFIVFHISDWLRAGQTRGCSSSPGGGKNFCLSMLSRPALGPTQSPTQWVLGAFSPGVKRPGREADHSPPFSAEVKKSWVYTSTPTYAFMA